MLAETAIPRFARGHRLQHDRVRAQWVIQAPERAFVADPVAASVLQLVDGERDIAAIIDRLAAEFASPRAVIATDVLAMLSDLASRGVLLT
jgi:pyrroloquinoline quinone biosynthesis protein D